MSGSFDEIWDVLILLIVLLLDWIPTRIAVPLTGIWFAGLIFSHFRKRRRITLNG